MTSNTKKLNLIQYIKQGHFWGKKQRAWFQLANKNLNSILVITEGPRLLTIINN
jgi:hypothetical protein